jgi:hypothetical protein
MTSLPALIEVPYLGQRDYVHGTTLFKHMLPYMRDARNISFKIARLLRRTRLRFEAIAASAGPAAEYCCTCHWHEGDTLCGVGVAEWGDTPHPSRESYDEEGIAALACFDVRTASIERSSVHPFIELVVAVNKKLLQRTLGEHVGLLFTRLDLTDLPAAPFPLTLTFERDIGMRHFASRITVAKRAVGQIYFSRRTP